MWIAAGQPYQLLWQLTMRETDVVLRGARKAREREMELAAWHAWHVAALPKMKRFPRSPADLIPRRRKAGVAQGWQTIKNMARLWTAALGGEGGRNGE